MGSRNNEFNHVFNDLQSAIAERINMSNQTNFGELIKKAKRNNDKVIKAYEKELDLIRSFRNILVHDTIAISSPIAEPSEELIEMIRQLTIKIKYPKKVKDLFNAPVKSFAVTDNLNRVLQSVKDDCFSQFPVFDGNNLVGIISENGITNYLAANIEEDVISISDITIQEVLEVDEQKELFDIVKQDKSIYDIEGIFIKRTKTGRSPFVLLVSKDGLINNPGEITGIITPWDLPLIASNL